MATFGFSKTADDIEEPELMPEDWWDFEIVEEPKVLMNNALKEEVGEDASDEAIESALERNEKFGMNMVILLTSLTSDEIFNGRKFKAYLPYPSQFDEERYDGIGQKVYDAKYQRILDFAKAFKGDIDGEMITILPKLKGKCYITQGKAPGRERVTNSIDIFAGFKPYGDDDLTEGGN